MGTWGAASTPCSQLRDIQKWGSKGRREKTAKTSVFRPGASEHRRADTGGQKEHQKRSKDAPRQRDRERGCPLEDKTEKKREREGAEKAHLRRNMWGVANLPESTRK